MREIKFRAKTATTNRWVYGHYAFIQGYHVIYEDGEPFVIALNTLGQYTGLKDKNGVEICEGDIVTMIVFEDNDEYLGYVVFENGCFCLNISLDGTKYKVPASEWKETETIITVIGNIYENPELLEREAG